MEKVTIDHYCDGCKKKIKRKDSIQVHIDNYDYIIYKEKKYDMKKRIYDYCSVVCMIRKIQNIYIKKLGIIDKKLIGALSLSESNGGELSISEK